MPLRRGIVVSIGELYKTRVSPALAGFTTGVITTILTIAATLVSLRSDASRESLFLMLTWTMYIAAACAVLVFAWILLDAIRNNVQQLRHLSELEAHVPRLIRFRRRFDKIQVSERGDFLARYECEVESAVGSSVPWLTVPVAASALPDDPEWQSVTVRHISVDGVDFDPTLAFIRKSRTRIVNNPRFDGIILEEGVVRVPISLEPDRRRCAFVIEVELHGAGTIFEEDAYLVDIAYVTDEINVHIGGRADLRVFCSSRADYRVQASQFSGELLDTAESQLQSAGCHMGPDVQWRSVSTKIGYRYEIPISAQRLVNLSNP